MPLTQLFIFAFIVLSVLGAVALLVRGRPRPADRTGRESPPARKSAEKQTPPSEAPGERTREKGADDLDDLDDDMDVTLVTVRMDLERIVREDAAAQRSRRHDEPYAEVTIEAIDEDLEPAALAHRIVADQGAEEDLPTLVTDAFLVSAAQQTDRGHRRQQNQDRYLTLDNHGVYVVADGMGGYAGGEIAAQLAVDTIAQVYRDQLFEARVEAQLPRRATELAQAMQAANVAIWEQATDDSALRGMGTTLVAARFALRKKRVYIGHIGDSRCYRLRDGQFKQITQDHTLASRGVTGPLAARLLRAVGIGAEVEIDIIIAEPKVGDLYLLCSDGLNKMVPDDVIASLLTESDDLAITSQRLIDEANNRGGKDNVTAVLVAVRPPPTGVDD